MKTTTKVLHDAYAKCASRIMIAQERISCLEFAVRNNEDRYYYQENKIFNDAFTVLISELRHRLNDAYSEFFQYRNLFTKKQQKEIDKLVVETYAHGYKEIFKNCGIKALPTPKCYRLKRSELIEEIEKLRTRQTADEIIDELSKDLT